MRVDPIISHPLTPVEIRERAEAWYSRQVETLAEVHGREWPKYEHWFEDFLQESLRQRLTAIGWRPTR